MGLSRELTGISGFIVRLVSAPFIAFLQIPIDETGERHTYFATSARFPPRSAGSNEAGGVALGEGIDGGGVYWIDYEAEGTSERVQVLMKGLAEDGTAETVWRHTEEEFVRITGSSVL
ncbi:hypothetical protein F4821DRAFT_274908 [Hypoxylon rubiginosum]|uniref:Uncharacterized protein n=1 Tax=Hypoxylon rubiginosum TaxID=110542 RepID=A0ACC0CLY3_9PEZI|nr:hypothetical protein F4821DRAFT_274908 [Hypoxylon rubiginosum]